MKLSISQLGLGSIIGKGGKSVVITPSNISEIFRTLDDYAPVTLTEELLLSTGFYRLKKNYYALKNLKSHILVYSGQTGILYRKGMLSGIAFRYYHELQNILHTLIPSESCLCE